MTRFRLCVIATSLAAFCAATPILSVAQAEDLANAQTTTLSEDQAGAFVATLTDDLIAMVLAHENDEDARVTALTDVIEDRLAIGPIGRFILTQSSRQNATEAELARYEALVPRYIAATFAGQIDALASQTVVIGDTIRLNDAEAVVRSQLVSKSGREAAKVEWRVRLENGQPALLDALVNRTSPMVAQQKVAADVVRCSGLPAFLDYMQAVADNAERPNVSC